jgi:excisionase family DNA binding protein
MKEVRAGLVLLSIGEVGKMMGVDPKTVTRWQIEGKFTEYRTPGGHRRVDESEVVAYLQPKPRNAAAEAAG